MTKQYMKETYVHDKLVFILSADVRAPLVHPTLYFHMFL